MKRIIHYDLKHKDTDDYQDLYDALDEMNKEMITESVYWIDTELSQKDIYKKIIEAIHTDDEVFFISTDVDKKLFCEKITNRTFK